MDPYMFSMIILDWFIVFYLWYYGMHGVIVSFIIIILAFAINWILKWYRM